MHQVVVFLLKATRLVVKGVYLNMDGYFGDVVIDVGVLYLST